MVAIETALKQRFADAPVRVLVDPSVSDGSAVIIRVVSSEFEGLSQVKRHQMVYQVVTGFITSGALHAAKIIAQTPTEHSLTSEAAQ